jgi:hypothetical protein
MLKRILNLLFILVFFVLTLAACAPEPLKKYEAFPKMYNERPLAILVLPPINETTAADAKEYYSTTIAEPLSLSGYYVFPIEVISDILKNEGIYDTETLITTDPRKFKEYFGADGVMYIWIKKWNTTYYVVGGNVSVEILCLLKSTTSGESLWEYEGTVVQDTTASGSGGGLVGLLVNVVATAIQTAATDYVPIAKRTNYMILQTIPLGKYHPKYDKDKGDAAVIIKTK